MSVRDLNELLQDLADSELPDCVDALCDWIDATETAPDSLAALYFDLLLRAINDDDEAIYDCEDSLRGLFYLIVEHARDKSSCLRKLATEFERILSGPVELERLDAAIGITAEGLESLRDDELVGASAGDGLASVALSSCSARLDSAELDEIDGNHLYSALERSWALSEDFGVRMEIAVLLLCRPKSSDLESTDNLVLEYSLSKFAAEVCEEKPPSKSFGFPARESLEREGSGIAHSKPSEALLLLLMHQLLNGLEIVEEHYADLKKGTYTPGFNVVEGCLGCLQEFAGVSAAIAAYVKKQQLGSKGIFILVKALQSRFPYQPEKRELVVAIIRTLHDTSKGADRHSIVSRYAVGLGILDEAALPARSRVKYPNTLPLTLDALKKFQRLLKIKNSELGFRAKSKSIPKRWPGDVAAVYGWHNGSTEMAFVPVKEMASLSEEIQETMEEHLQDVGDDEDPDLPSGELDIRKCWSSRSIPIGNSASGDLFFVSTKLTSLSGYHPVIRFHHDEALMASVEASSLSEYLARLMVEKSFERDGNNVSLRRLLSETEPALKSTKK